MGGNEDVDKKGNMTMQMKKYLRWKENMKR